VLLMGTAHVFLNFSCQLRGYSLSMCVVALASCALVQYHRSGRGRWLGAYTLLAALGVGIVPTNIVPFAALALWLVGVAIPARPSARSMQRCGRMSCVNHGIRRGDWPVHRMSFEKSSSASSWICGI
jgi:hypothetical protein